MATVDRTAGSSCYRLVAVFYTFAHAGSSRTFSNRRQSLRFSPIPFWHQTSCSLYPVPPRRCWPARFLGRVRRVPARCPFVEGPRLRSAPPPGLQQSPLHPRTMALASSSGYAAVTGGNGGCPGRYGRARHQLSGPKGRRFWATIVGVAIRAGSCVEPFEELLVRITSTQMSRCRWMMVSPSSKAAGYSPVRLQDVVALDGSMLRTQRNQVHMIRTRSMATSSASVGLPSSRF